MKAATEQRAYGIDLLRGVACVSVLVFHYLSRAPRAGWMTDVPLRQFEPAARYGYLGVHLFFMVSGYVIFMSAIGRSPRAFVASRVARLYPALWFAATITMLLVWGSGDTRFMVSVPEYLWNLTLVPQYAGARFVDGAYWSLAVELQFYILVWIALRTKLMPHVEWLVGGWLFLSLIDAIRPIYVFERWLIVQWAPLFVAGATTFLVSSRGWTRARIALLATAFALALRHASMEAHRLASEWNATGPDAIVVCVVLTVAAAAFVLIGVGRITMRRSRWATIPGILTYPLYLIHQFAGYVIYAAVSRVSGSFAFGLVGAALFAVMISVALHYGVEVPLGPRLRRLISGAAPRPG